MSVNVRSLARRAAVAASLATLLVATVPVGQVGASATPGDGTRTVANRHGSCSGPTSWRLSVKYGSGNFDVIFSGSGGASGQKWSIYMDDNHEGFFHGSRTSGTGGSFAAKASTPDKSGSDKIVVGGQNQKTGETCRARVTI